MPGTRLGIAAAVAVAAAAEVVTAAVSRLAADYETVAERRKRKRIEYDAKKGFFF